MAVNKVAQAPFRGLGAAFCLFGLLFACGAFSPPGARAEVPVKFTYQGNLRQNGYLVNGQRNMVFRIYASSDSAAPVWTSPAYSVGVSTGVFRVLLDPVIADWETGGLWLEPEVEGNRLLPREELTSSPYAVNALLHSGKRYTTSPTAPAGVAQGDLWFDSGSKVLKFWDGVLWTEPTAVAAAHAPAHAGSGTDPILSLGTHTVTGGINIEGVVNAGSQLRVGGAGYSVQFASAVSAGWYYGDGSGLSNLNASNVSSGRLSGDRIAAGVIVSSHVADLSLDRTKLAGSGCAAGNTLKWDGAQWVCTGSGAGAEIDPLSIHNQDTLQAGATFYVSSGTVADLNVARTLSVDGTARIRAPDSQPYSLIIGTGAVSQVVVSTAGAVGIGTDAPRARLDVAGEEGGGRYIAVFTSGSKMAAWLRNK